MAGEILDHFNYCCVLKRNQFNGKSQITKVYFFMFCWPCFSIPLCIRNQPDALFIINLFRQSTSTCFGHIYSPSSGGKLYIYSKWYVSCFSVVCLLVGQHVTTVVYIFSIPPDDGLQICPKHVEVD